MSDVEKAAAGRAAIDFVKDGMIVGLGTGTTTYYFIDSLIQKHREGLHVQVVASSERSLAQAKAGGLPAIDLEKIDQIDLTVDGADEIDPQKRMIKGGGGALLREKILAASSKEMIVVIGSNKWVDALGRFPLPIEIVSFGAHFTVKKIENAGFQGKIRTKEGGNLYWTDNGNLIYDIQLPYPCTNPEAIDRTLREIPGVVTTGFFFTLAGRVIIGLPNGQVEIKN